MRRALVVLLVLLAPPAAAQSVFPLGPGDRWTYEVRPASGPTVRRSIAVDASSGRWFHLDDLLGRPRWVAVAGDVVTAWDGRAVGLYALAGSPTRWRVALSGAAGIYSRAPRAETVVTGAGTFNGCVRIDSDRGRSQWLAPGVGLVRWTDGGEVGILVEASVGGRSFGGPAAARPTTLAGMGAIPYAGGVAFRVWAPNAAGVSVAGEWNGWSATAHPMVAGDGGTWSVEIDGARPGQAYRYAIDVGGRLLWKNDPRARLLSADGRSVVHDPEFDWRGDRFRIASWNELIVYELHVGTFADLPGGRPGDFASAIGRLDDLADLGINAVELLPVHEFAGDFSWGYNPGHPFAVEGAYGGPLGLKTFVREAHARGIAVLVDVVYNHFGPQDLPLWRFDGWSENDLGGIFFYNDHRARTPWGHTRPDYGRPAVRDYLADNARMWLDEYRADGLRWDSTVNIRTVENGGGGEIPDGWRLMQRINDDVDRTAGHKIQIAEDLQGNDWLVRPTGDGGAGFDAQWDPGFVHPVREAIIGPSDERRSMARVADALRRGAGFRRVVYTESHDEVANGRSRVPEEIWPGKPDSWYSRKRSTVGGALVLTAPGIPMLFQGQEMLEDGWFADDDPVDWAALARHAPIRRLHRDLIALRRGGAGRTVGLTGPSVNVFHVNEGDKVLAFHRWRDGGAGDDVVVVVNLANRAWDRYTIGLPRGGTWRLRLDSDGAAYGFGGHPAGDRVARGGDRDGLAYQADVSIGPYTVQIYSQDP